MSHRIQDFPTWKTGSSLATGALLAWLVGFAGLALILALAGAAFMVGALASKSRKSAAGRPSSQPDERSRSS